MPGVLFRAQAFTPTFSKYQGEFCQGVQLHVLDREKFDPIRTTLHLLAQIHKLYPDKFEIRAASFDRLAGTGRVRERLLAGDAVDEIIRSWAADLKTFQATRRKYLLY